MQETVKFRSVELNPLQFSFFEECDSEKKMAKAVILYTSYILERSQFTNNSILLKKHRIQKKVVFLHSINYVIKVAAGRAKRVLSVWQLK